jgi:succinate dehydrogenase/fumarate reductase flavoprotein subunit
LPDLLVSGKISGENAAEAALSGKHGKVNMANFGMEVKRTEKEMMDVVETDNGISPITIRNEIKNLSWDYVGIARSEEKLKHAIETLEEMKARRLPRIGDRGRSFNIEFIEAMDVRSLIVSLEVMARAALIRTESRCGHFREDYPLPEKNWVLNIVSHQNPDGELVFEKRPIVKTLLDPDEVEMPIFPVCGLIDE